MSKVRTLGYTLNHAIQENFSPGESKRSAKFQLQGETCNEKTLLKTVSHLAKLELCCKCTYASEKINWGVKEIIIPVSANNSGIAKDKPMDWETSQKIIDYMTRPGTRSEAYRSLELSRLLGMRVEETVNARANRFHLEPSRAFPFGYVEIRKGDGSKGNRPRIIPIQTREQLESLKLLCAGKTGNDFIIQKSKIGNQPLEKKSVRYVNRILGHGEERCLSELSHYANNIW